MPKGIYKRKKGINWFPNHQVFKKGQHGSVKTEFKKGDRGHLNFKHSDLTKREMGRTRIGKQRKREEQYLTPLNGRIGKSIEFRLWREAVFARDNWTCQKYGIRGGKLVVHHIQNFADYPELRFAIDNVITLSEKAHIEFHKIYGKRNNTKEQLEEFFGGSKRFELRRLD